MVNGGCGVGKMARVVFIAKIVQKESDKKDRVQIYHMCIYHAHLSFAVTSRLTILTHGA